jgi:hypothetical protein
VALTNLARQDAQTIVHGATGQRLVIPEIRRTSYIAERLRLVPELRAGDRARITLQVDALDDVLWGDNNGVAAAPLLAHDASNQGFLGGDESPSVQVKRAWIEVGGSVLGLQVGRMPSHWGLGILENGGGSSYRDDAPPPGAEPRRSLDTFLDDDFGDNHFGSTADRAVVTLRPIGLYRAVRGRRARPSPLSLGYGYGVVSEAPLLGAEPFERRFRPFGQQGFISRGGRDDIDEHVAFALWDDPYWQPGGRMARDTDELRGGARWALRRADEGSTNPSALDPSATCGVFEGQPEPCRDTGSRVWTADAWFRARYGPFYAEAEGARSGGTTFGGLPFPAANRKSKLRGAAGVARAGLVVRDPAFDPIGQLLGGEPFERDLWELELEAGYARGDRDPGDGTARQLAMHPDFNVGLILFEELVRELTARAYGPPLATAARPDGAVEMFSQGGVVNAKYVLPKLRYRLPAGESALVVGLLMAWADQLAEPGAPGVFAADRAASRRLGTELDGALRATLHEHVELSIEAGCLWYGDALRSALPNASSSFTLQSRAAFVW